MELPDITQKFIRSTPGGEEGQSAALAAGAARDGVTEWLKALRLRSTRQGVGACQVWVVPLVQLARAPPISLQKTCWQRM